MAKAVIYHNPRCSKSRQTLAILEENGVDTEVVEYLNNPLDKGELKELIGKLGLPAKSIVRTKEDLYKEDKFDLESEDTVIKNLASKPKLMERPIVVVGKKAVIGRPPENVNKLI